MQHTSYFMLVFSFMVSWHGWWGMTWWVRGCGLEGRRGHGSCVWLQGGWCGAACGGVGGAWALGGLAEVGGGGSGWDGLVGGSGGNDGRRGMGWFAELWGWWAGAGRWVGMGGRGWEGRGGLGRIR